MGWLCALGAGVLGPGGATDHAGAAGVGTGNKMKIFLEVFVNRRINLPLPPEGLQRYCCTGNTKHFVFSGFFSYIP